MDVIAIYPGRFHPFHKGHAASFKQLASKFGLENTYLAISAKQEQPKSPFSASDRAKMANSLGIPSDHILVVNNPYNAKEYIDRFSNQGYDPEKTVLVFGVSKKDMEGDPALGIPPDPRFSFQPKKDGSPSYLQPFTTKGLKPMTKHGYILSTDVAEFPIAGQTMRDASAIRKAYAGADDKTKMKILHDLYGDAAEQIKSVFDNNLQVTESILRLISRIKPLLSEATLSQKAKFVKLLSEAKSLLTESNASATIDTPMKQVQRDSRLKIVQEPNNFYIAVDRSDPRPEVKPNLKLINRIEQLETLYKDLIYARDELQDELGWENKNDPRLAKLAQQIKQVYAKLEPLYAMPKHISEGRERLPDNNFTPDDLELLSRIRDLPTLKQKAFDLITNPNSSRPMLPQKVAWFKHRLEQLNSKESVIKLMYDLLLSGEGNKVIGSRYSTDSNVYRKMFAENDTKKIYSKGQAAIIDELGNGYFLGDDSYGDDEGFTKEGYSVYYQEGPDQFRHVDSVNVSPYASNRKPGEVEQEINRIINMDMQSTQNAEKISENIDYIEEK